MDSAATISLHPGKYVFDVKMDMMGQEMEFDQVTTIIDSGSVWRIIEETKMPMGEMVDKVNLNKENLSPITRQIDNGPINIELNYSDKRVEGRMNMSGTKTPLQVTTTGLCKADGPGAFLSLQPCL